MATSSIHIQRAVAGSVGHNSREHFSHSVVFTNEKNECTTEIKEAYKTYRSELQIRTEAYTNRTGQKLQKKAVTQLSAVINLEAHHTLKDLEPIKAELERLFDTKVYQMAIHRDEGKLVSKEDGTELYSGKDFFLNPEKDELFFDKKFTKPVPMENYEVVKNYHAHIEMMGLDSKGNAIRQKMNRVALQGLQTTVAKTLQMERGKPRDGYTKEEMKEILKVVGKKSDYENTTLYAQKFNDTAKELGIFKESNKRKDTHQFKDDGAEREKGKRAVLATQKDLNAEIALLRSQLKEQGATRADYAQLEQINRELKEQIKAKDLTVDQLTKSLETVRTINHYSEGEKAELRSQIILKDQMIDHLKEAPPEPINASLIVQLQDENKMLKVINKGLEIELSEAKRPSAAVEIPKGDIEQIEEVKKLQQITLAVPNTDERNALAQKLQKDNAIDEIKKSCYKKVEEKGLIYTTIKTVLDKDVYIEKLEERERDHQKLHSFNDKIVIALVDKVKTVVEMTKTAIEAVKSKFMSKSLSEVQKERTELNLSNTDKIRGFVDQLKEKEQEKPRSRGMDLSR